MLKILPLRHRHSYVLRAHAGKVILDPHELFRLWVWQGVQERGIYDAGNRCRGSNPRGDGQDSDGGETRRLTQHAQTVAGVLPEVIPSEPAAGFVEAFFGLHEVAEGATRGCSGLLFTQSSLPQALDLELQVCFDFGCEVVEFALASEHGISFSPSPVLKSARWPPSIACIC